MIETPCLGAILIVEDHDSTRRTLARILKLKGWHVLTAATVAEGLAKLDPEPGCIVLDLMLPDGGGEAVLDRIRAAGLSARVIVCTGVDDQARLEAVNQLRPAAILKKPIEVDEIERVCRS